MTNPEFSTQFDILWNNISSDQAPGLNEYEKSVFLTKAQNQLVKEYFNVRTDGVGGGFDGSIGRQYDFSSIIETVELKEVNTNEDSDSIIQEYMRIHEGSHLFVFPVDYFLTVNEAVYEDTESNGKKRYSVVPIDYAEYQRLILKPYPFPVKREAWRLMSGSATASIIEGIVEYKVPIAEVIGRFSGTITYRMKYVKNLSPIILENLSTLDDSLTIEGISNKMSCKLPEECHHEILERAVTLAKLAWQGNTLTQAQAAQTK